MLIRKPAYFDQFRCIAGACPDSCCKEWEVQVDPDSAAVYRNLTGPLGERLRQVLREEAGEILMTITDGRCPMWREDGLCRIQAELGEQALCQVCREFPRLTHDYGDFRELGLELSCPEAARWILGDRGTSLLREERAGGEAAEYDREAMAVLLETRENMLAILGGENRPVPEVLVLALLYGYQAQARLDGGEKTDFDPEAALASARDLARPGNTEAVLAFFRKLEILTPQWRQRLEAPGPAAWEERHLALARYLVQRYWLQAVADYDLYSRVKFMVIACLLVRTLGGDLQETAQLFSKEIENDIDNVEDILDGAYEAPAFRDDCLLGLLLEE